MTQDEFHAKFPGIDTAFICTQEHPTGDAPGSMMWLVSAGAISLKKVGPLLPDEIVVHDADRVRSMIASLPKTDRDKKARALFDKCISKLVCEDEHIDEWIVGYAEMMKERLDRFRLFILGRGLPTTADIMTWHALFREEWEVVNGDVLSRAQIAELARDR